MLSNAWLNACTPLAWRVLASLISAMIWSTRCTASTMCVMVLPAWVTSDEPNWTWAELG